MAALVVGKTAQDMERRTSGDSLAGEASCQWGEEQMGSWWGEEGLTRGSSKN